MKWGNSITFHCQEHWARTISPSSASESAAPRNITIKCCDGFVFAGRSRGALNQVEWREFERSSNRLRVRQTGCFVIHAPVLFCCHHHHHPNPRIFRAEIGVYDDADDIIIVEVVEVNFHFSLLHAAFLTHCVQPEIINQIDVPIIHMKCRMRYK